RAITMRTEGFSGEEEESELVPSSLAPIVPILRAANAIEDENPRVAYLITPCRSHTLLSRRRSRRPASYYPPPRRPFSCTSPTTPPLPRVVAVTGPVFQLHKGGKCHSVERIPWC
uniref:Uncharacterized protein n=1 Tax=Aegilops tauschii subsp. strangulata TaxID=200361 RepID=A0A453DH24_AEGTS